MAKDKKDSKPEEDELKVLFRRFSWGVLAFTIIVLLCTAFTNTCTWLNAITIFLGVGAGCLAFGAAIGFLFGIPRVQKVGVAPVADPNGLLNGSYHDNTNLEDISDWLTKIILGLTLVELKKIIVYLDIAAKKVSASYAGMCCPECAADFYPFAYAIIVFYFLFGAWLSYLWTRSSLLSILEERRLARMEKLNERLYNQNNKLTKTAGAVASELTNQQNAQDNPQVDNIGLAVNEIVKAPDPDFVKEMEEMNRKRKIQFNEDLQRARWGGKTFVNDITLSALYVPSEIQDIPDGYFKIQLKVEAGRGAKLGDHVAFFLHDSFPRPVKVVVVSGARAVFTLVTYEAFVVGARTQSGVDLELNLNKVQGFPPDFYYPE